MPKKPRIFHPIWLVCVSVFISAGLYYYRHLHTVQPVIASEVYRSAQLDKDELSDNIRALGIKNIINLRGRNSGVQWYEDEKSISASLGVIHHDIRLSSEGLPLRSPVLKLAELLENVERPVLIHCQGGVDRAGLGSVVALLGNKKAQIEEAEKHVSLKYLASGSDSTGKVFFKQYNNWLTQNDLIHSPARFKDWLEHRYVDKEGNFRFYIDAINEARWTKDTQYDDGYSFTIERTRHDYLQIKGWAFDAIKDEPVKNIQLLLDSQIMSDVKYGIPLPNVATYFAKPGIINSGWHIRESLDAIKNACYGLKLKLERVGGTQWQSPPMAKICIK